MQLLNDLAALRAYWPQAAVFAPQVSAKGVAWHIDHSLRVLTMCLGAAQASKPEDYRWAFNFNRLYIFLRGSIPRGRGKAPKVVLPPEEIDPLEVEALFKKAEALCQALPQMPAKAHFKHPFFGLLHRAHTAKFLHIHTAHHLAIIRDIIAQAPDGKA